MNATAAHIERVEGPDKVTGRARYMGDERPGRMAHAAIVPAQIGKGFVEGVDTTLAERVPGFLLALTLENMQRFEPIQFGQTGGHASQSFQPLQSNRVAYRGQAVAMVMAETLEAAQEAAWLVKVSYRREPFAVQLDAPGGESVALPKAIPLPPFGEKVTGDAEAAMKTAEVTVDGLYETPAQHQNPIELLTTIAAWDGDKLTVHEPTQNSEAVRNGVATQLAVPPANVRVVSTLLGGSFGQRNSMLPWTAIVAVAAKRLARPVKLTITRGQLYHAAAFRAASRQRIRLGARPDGTIVAALHETQQQTSRFDTMPPLQAHITAHLYGIDNFRSVTRVTRLDTQTPGFMRAPHEMPASFAFEGAMDELAVALGMDPVALRLKNDTDRDPISKKAFSSRHVAACLRRGAERFEWSRRDPRPGSMRTPQGALIGMGVALGTYKASTSPAVAKVRLLANGTVEASVAGHEMGQGMRTALAITVAGPLGIAPAAVQLTIGDTIAPPQHLTAGSWGTASAVPAIESAATELRTRLIGLARTDERSPLRGARAEDLRLTEGRVVHADGRRIDFAQLLAAVGRPFVEAQTTRVAPGQNEQALARVASGRTSQVGPEYPGFVSFSYVAHFSEVHIDPATRHIRMHRSVAVIDCGKVVSPTTSRSQALGGLVWGIGAALREVSEVDPRFGGFVNTDLAEYVIPVHADMGEMTVDFIDIPDTQLNTAGVKGLGEVVCVGAAASIANAVFHATGHRFRKLPIRIDDVLAATTRGAG